ncbi:tyrosine-type recombinase/integrase [Nocardia cyriacigeorgica]|uniref:tyrosine-type recombinase/integrase n=1 Tax=Nocardia cyriacigeorgica TaxID=135487 RepID=UPI000CEB431F|nr:tyrosine-type recombinase/integrase [Nocardia cyriacigeorgica]AVH20257.1 integrase [Nocardia cyriacigeorgica]
MTATPAPPAAEAIAAARLLLAQMGISPADLVTSPTSTPTFGEVIPKVRSRLSAGTLRTYNSAFNHLLDKWSDTRLDAISKDDLEQMKRAIQSGARVNRASRGGTSAAEHFVGATRCVFRFAEDNGWIRPADNPARQLDKPSRRPSRRFAIPSAQLTEICEVAAFTGNDCELDTLILRLHIETACRRGGALALRPIDLDPDQCLVYLREKEGTDRWQPVSPTLMRHLLEHAEHRGSPRTGRLLRYRNGREITSRRFDYIWNRIGTELPWVAMQGITMHWLRHTTLTWVERTFSYAVAREYAGHHGKAMGTTSTYVKSSLHEVAAALSVLTGEPHPLAPGPTRQT